MMLICFPYWEGVVINSSIGLYIPSIRIPTMVMDQNFRPGDRWIGHLGCSPFGSTCCFEVGQDHWGIFGKLTFFHIFSTHGTSKHGVSMFLPCWYIILYTISYTHYINTHVHTIIIEFFMFFFMASSGSMSMVLLEHWSRKPPTAGSPRLAKVVNTLDKTAIAIDAAWDVQGALAMGCCLGV